MDEKTDRPLRSFRALLIAPLLPLVLFLAWKGPAGFSVAEMAMLYINLCLFYVYPAVLIMGVPTLLILQPLLRPSLIAAIIIGAAVAALPWALLALLAPAAFPVLWREFLGPAIPLGGLGGAIFFVVATGRGLRCGELRQ